MMTEALKAAWDVLSSSNIDVTQLLDELQPEDAPQEVIAILDALKQVVAAGPSE